MESVDGVCSDCHSRDDVGLQMHWIGKAFHRCFLIIFSSQILFSCYLRVPYFLKDHPTGCWVFHVGNTPGNVASPELDWKSDLPCNGWLDCWPGLDGQQQGVHCPWNQELHGDISYDWVERWKGLNQVYPDCGSPEQIRMKNPSAVSDPSQRVYRH